MQKLFGVLFNVIWIVNNYGEQRVVHDVELIQKTDIVGYLLHYRVCIFITEF